MQNDELAAYGLRSMEGSTPDIPHDDQSEPMHNATIRDPNRLFTCTIVLAHMARYLHLGEMRAPLSSVSNSKLGEHLIGMDSFLRMPADYWPVDGVTWSVQVVEHEHGDSTEKHLGGHVFKVVLAESSPICNRDVVPWAVDTHVTSSNGYVVLWAMDLSAKQIRRGIEAAFGKDKTLEQMLDHKNSSLAQIMLGVPPQLGGALQRVKLAVRSTIKQQMKSQPGKLRHRETNATGACAAMTLAMSTMICEDADDVFAGIWPAPKHYNAAFGRPDEKK